LYIQEVNHMGIPRFFKLPKNKQFNYQPLYYDPMKEDREARRKQIDREFGNTSDKGYSPRITKGAMREYFKRENKARKQSNLRLIIIVMVLLFIAYLLLFR